MLNSVRPQVWSGSRDKTILAHDSTSMATMFSLGDQGAGVKLMLSHTWFVWSFNMKGIKVGDNGDEICLWTLMALNRTLIGVDFRGGCNWL